MKIAVIAANGRTGRMFVAAALAAGHEVKAGVHAGNPFSPTARLTVIECDATNPEDVERLIFEQDALVSFIGHIKGSPARVQTVAITAAIAAMKKQGMLRIVSLTGTGVRFPGDRVTVLDRLLNVSIAVIDPDRVNDGIAHVEALKMSGLDWTVLRVLKLQNTKPGRFTLSEHGPTKPYVSREEVAAAALEVLEHNSFIQKAPILSTTG